MEKTTMRERLIDEQMLWPSRGLTTESDPAWLRFAGDLLQSFDEEAHYHAAMGFGDPAEEPSNAPWLEFWTAILPFAAKVAWAAFCERVFGSPVCPGCHQRANDAIGDEPACADCVRQVMEDAEYSVY